MNETEWRQVPGWPDYEASSDGRVRRATPGPNTAPGKELRQSPNVRHQYLTVMLCRRGFTKRIGVHRIVCETFHGAAPTPKHEAAHWDGNRQNNVKGNLRWATRRQNRGDSIRLGAYVGERNTQARLRAAAVREIRRLALSGEPHATIADRFKVSPATISDIVNGRRWASLL